MSTHLYANQIADEIISKLKAAHETPLSLNVVAKGDLGMYPSIEAWSSWLNAILVNPVKSTFEFSSSVGRDEVDYNFDIYYLRRWVDGEKTKEVDIANAQSITETLIANERLPGLNISSMEVWKTYPTEIIYEDEVAAIFEEHRISAMRIGFQVFTKVIH